MSRTSTPLHGQEANHPLVQAGAIPLQQVPEFLQQTLSQLIAYLPRIIGAIIILIIAWIVGRIIAGIINRVGDAADLDQRVADTSIERFTGDLGLSNVLGKIAAYYIYFIGILAAADALAIPTLSQWLSRLVSYLPSFIAGVLIILFGFLLADFVADVISQSGGGQGYVEAFGTGIQLFLYFTVITIGLDTMGVNTKILYIVTRAFAYAMAFGIVIALALAFGWGGRDFVADNIYRWAGQARDEVEEVSDEAASSNADTDATDTSPSG